jgi:hypothetical protein
VSRLTNKIGGWQKPWGLSSGWTNIATSSIITGSSSEMINIRGVMFLSQTIQFLGLRNQVDIFLLKIQ